MPVSYVRFNPRFKLAAEYLRCDIIETVIHFHGIHATING